MPASATTACRRSRASRSWSRPPGRQSFWQWLKAKYGYTDEQARPYTFSLAPFLADRNMCMQGFVTTEPFALRAAGADPVTFLLADHGFDNYPRLLISSASRKVTGSTPAARSAHGSVATPQ